ncbi:MAG TPA: alpha/beta fold hydrolase [Alphaproteobacteria bacterium]|nr:alpha/beta fold hydrolase [Alphaproteobacteria bacterium]
MPLDLVRVSARDNEVAVLIYEPRRPRNVSIVAGHGYSSSKHNLDFLCAFLQSHGFRVYNLDFPGHKLGASGGELRGFDDCVDAMGAVVALARERGDDPVYTLGHSMGAIAALFVAAQDRTIAGSVAIATGYGRPSALTVLRAAGATDFRSSYVDGVDLPTLLEDIDGSFDRLIPQLEGRPVFYVAAARDAMVSPASVRELYERAPEPKSFALIESDHTYAGEHARSDVLQWLNRLHPRG